MKTTRRFVAALRVSLCLAAAVHPLSAQAPGSEAPGQSATVAFAERAAVRSLGFTQGDARSFAAGRPDFTDSAWTSFRKEFEGFRRS